MNSVKQVLDEHAAFWHCGNNEPLLHEIEFKGFGMNPYPVMGGHYVVNVTPITASDIDVERLLGLDKKLPEPVVGRGPES